MIILGVDPGIKGGLAVLDGLKILSMIEMPVLYREIHLNALSIFFQSCKSYGVDFMAIEDVHAYPKQGVVSCFRFGEAKGILLGMAAAFKIPIVKISPAVWKSDLNLSSDKSRSLVLARKLWPSHIKEFQTNKDVDKAEAALIAYFASKHVGHL